MRHATIFLCLLAAGYVPLQAAAVDDATPLSSPDRPFNRANLEKEHASRDARHVADWVVHSGDNHDMPFVIVDKKEAKIFAFHADGRLRGAAPALLGQAKGDTSVPGIGNRKLSSIKLAEKTTPAGRFVAELGVDERHKDVLWVDYEGAVAIHRVVTSNPKERRLQRLASKAPGDHRISFGCINVPVKFYESVLLPSFTGTKGIVYVLPEIETVEKIFASYDVEEHLRKQLALQPAPTRGAVGN